MRRLSAAYPVIKIPNDALTRQINPVFMKVFLLVTIRFDGLAAELNYWLKTIQTFHRNKVLLVAHRATQYIRLRVSVCVSHHFNFVFLMASKGFSIVL